MLNGKSVLVTGGTGSFGKAFVRTVLAPLPATCKRLVVFSRDELKQYEMAQRFSEPSIPACATSSATCATGPAAPRAMEGIDIVVHAAALKQVPAAEYNPFECIKTNVLGAQNVIEACLDSGVQRVVALSTDKAAAPINLYGATKLCSRQALHRRQQHQAAAATSASAWCATATSWAAAGRSSRSSWSGGPAGVLPITDPRMTRFNISLQEGVEMVLWALENAWGGEIFVPKIPSYRILDVAEAVGPDVPAARSSASARREDARGDDHRERQLQHRGPRAATTRSCPPAAATDVDEYCERTGGELVEPGFSYNSGTNPEFLTVEEMRALIRRHVSGSRRRGVTDMTLHPLRTPVRSATRTSQAVVGRAALGLAHPGAGGRQRSRRRRRAAAAPRTPWR